MILSPNIFKLRRLDLDSGMAMEPITYSIKTDDLNSEEYYKTAKEFSDELMKEAENVLSPIVKDFKTYLNTYRLEEIRENEEYVVELLSFGILWKEYSSTALAVNYAPYILLIKLGEIRKKRQKLKPTIDLLRGILNSLFLFPKNFKEVKFPPTLEEIDKVSLWLEAANEFREEAYRFVRWRAFWATLTEEELNKVFYAIAEFANYFERRANEVLGKYTLNVENFLENSKGKYKWREDRISCSRSRSEYHLNMVGAELLNRAYEREFKESQKVAVLLPGCMRKHNDENCKATRAKKGLKCSACEADCLVNELRVAGKKKDFEVYIIPHSSDLSLWANKPGEAKRGVIASACVSTLVEGGLELKRYGIPAQCVLLDYCGCKKHWHNEGIPTEFNIAEFERILAKC